MKNADLTVHYYNKNAKNYELETFDADLGPLQNEFLLLLPGNGVILDLGCVSGRDSKFFLGQGYRVVVVDGSTELCRLAAKNIGQSIVCCDFREYEPERSR